MSETLGAKNDDSIAGRLDDVVESEHSGFNVSMIRTFPDVFVNSCVTNTELESIRTLCRALISDVRGYCSLYIHE